MTRDSTPMSTYICSIHKQVIFLLSFGCQQLTKMVDQDRDAAYYGDLFSKILRMKSKKNQRRKKKDTFYIEDLAARRKKISTRTDTLVLNAMEIELQTHMKINLQIKNDKGKKVIRSHKSFGYERPSGDGEQRRLNSNERAQAEQQPQLTTTPTMRHNIVESTPGSSSSASGQNGCKIY